MKITEVYKKYQEQLNYLIFGALTTIINIIVYYVGFNVLHLSNVNSNIMAWILSVLFAYITNKLWVFKNYNTNLIKLLFEIFSFFGCRLATGLMDIIIMYIAVDILLFPGLVMKVLSNILVIILNYVASKLFIFN